jgi:hypothetical protein
MPIPANTFKDPFQLGDVTALHRATGALTELLPAHAMSSAQDAGRAVRKVDHPGFEPSCEAGHDGIALAMIPPVAVLWCPTAPPTDISPFASAQIFVLQTLRAGGDLNGHQRWFGGLLE